MAVHQSCVEVILKNLSSFQDFSAYAENKASCPGGQVSTLSLEIADLLEVTILEAEGLVLEMAHDGIFNLVRLWSAPFFAQLTTVGRREWREADAKDQRPQ